MSIAINGSGTITGVSVGGLPDGIVDEDMLAANAVTAAKSSGSAKGITEFDMWRVSSSFAQQNAVITSNWERADTQFDKIGTGLTESSGIFSFPSTGIYLINFQIYSWESGGTAYHGGTIDFSTDSGSNYTTRVEMLTNSYNTGSAVGGSVFMHVTLDVTNTSTNRVRFSTVGDSEISFVAHSDQQRVGFTCLKLGDT